MISKISDYFVKRCGHCARFETPDCSALLRHVGLVESRRECLEVELTKTVKWGSPFYTQAGRVVVALGWAC